MLLLPAQTERAYAQEVAEAPAIAAQTNGAPIKIKVTTTTDEWNIPGNTSEAINSKCSLREALQAVVGNINGNQGCGYVAPNESEYVLDLIPGTYKLTKAANKPDELPNLVDGKKVTIDGFNAVVIDGGKNGGRYVGIFKVVGGWLVLKNVTMQNGSALFGCAINQLGGTVEIDNAIFKENDCVTTASDNQGEGGAIYSSGQLTVSNSLFDSNGARLYGGAIASGGVVYLQNVTFSKNFAWLGGGAISHAAGNMTVVESLFEKNSIVGHPNTPNPYNHLADYGSGGAIRNAGTLTLNKVAFQGNYTYKVKGGGALGNEGGTVYVYDSGFKANKANPQAQVTFTYGGAIYNAGTLQMVRTTLYQNEASYGGAIFNRLGEAKIANSTISSNKATKEAPGVGNGHISFPNSENGLVWIDQSTVVYNTDASGKYHSLYSYKPHKYTVLNSLFDGGCDNGIVITRGYNIFGQPCTTTSIDSNFDFTLADLNPIPNPSQVSLGGLANNGGPALKGGVDFSSHKPQGSSAAIDVAGDEGCTHELVAKFDQASHPRDQGNCDGGSIEGGTNPPEFESVPDEGAILSFEPTPINALGDFEVQLKLTNGGGGVYSFYATTEGAHDLNNQYISESSFTVVNDEGWVFPSKPVTLSIRCRPPLAPGDYYTYLYIHTDLKAKPVASYTLHCPQPDPNNAHASPDQPNGPTSMGSPQPGNTAQNSFTIVGRGKVPVNLTAQSTTNSNGVISISTIKGGAVAAASGDAPITLANGEKATVTATCAPVDEGLFQETLTITTDDPKAPTLTYNFSCEGVYKKEVEKLAGTEYHFELPKADYWAIAVSPDGRQVIGGHESGNRIRPFDRNVASGSLTGHTPIALAGMTSIRDIDYSHDGTLVYVASAGGDGITVLKRAANNELSVSQVITKETKYLCGFVNNLPKFCAVGVMYAPYALAVSPDDQQVYVASAGDGSLTVLQRSQADPNLLFYTQSFTETINGVKVMDGAGDVLVSPDGKNVYVTARASSSISVFTRADNGRLSYLRSYSHGQDGISLLIFPGNMAISPDGKFLYVPSYSSHAINVFARSDSDGSLQLVQGISGLTGAFSVAISHDPAGERLLLTLYDGDRMLLYSRNEKSGELTFVEDYAQPTVSNFAMPTRLTTSADDRSVYVAMSEGQGIQAFASRRKQPVLANLSPASAVVGSGDLQLTVNGNNFYPESQIVWGGKTLTTSFVDVHKLTATVTAADLANAGTVNIQVRTPQPGGGDSSAKTFTVTTPAQLPTPSIESINPAALDATLTEEIALLVKGANFTAQSKVLLNGAPLPTSFVNANTLTAILAPGVVSGAGPLAISVSNSNAAVAASSAGVDVSFAEVRSTAVKFESTGAGAPAAPAIQSLSPTSVKAGSTDLQVTVTGFNFSDQIDARSQLLWNGEPRPTTIFNANTLLATISAADLAAAGKASVSIYTPGAGESSTLDFTILADGENPVPQISGASAGFEGGQWLLSIYGAGLVNGAQVRFNGQSRAATYIDDTQVTVVVSEAELNSGGVLQVLNPQPGGGASNEIVLQPRQTQSINFAPLSDKQMGAAPFVVSALATSGLAVRFSSTTPAICTVSENAGVWKVTLVAAGQCTLVASQNGDYEFSAATNVERSFQVQAAPPPLKLVFLPLLTR